MRKGNPTPLQYTYVAADCRLYFTLDNVFNMTSLWHDVSEAAWGKKKLCVEGSVGYASHGDVAPELPPPELSVTAPPSPAFELGIDLDAGEVGEGITAGEVALQPSGGIGQPCVPCVNSPCQPTGCASGYSCMRRTLLCPAKLDPFNTGRPQPQPTDLYICVLGCESQQQWMCEQSGVNECVGQKQIPSRTNVPPNLSLQGRPRQGAPNAQGPVTSRQVKGINPSNRIPPAGPAIPPMKQPIGVPHGNPSINPGVAPSNQRLGGNFQSNRGLFSQTTVRPPRRVGICQPRVATTQMGCK